MRRNRSELPSWGNPARARRARAAAESGAFAQGSFQFPGMWRLEPPTGAPSMRHDSSMSIFLETERLVLRRFTEDDVDNLVELDSDPDVMRFINGGRPTPRHEIESDVLPAFLDYYERFAGYGFWAVVEKSTRRFVGWFHFRPAKGASADEIELGYRLRKSAWGKGYATEGSRALIDKGFADLGVERVVAFAMVVNVASRRVMEKAGLKFVRIFHQPWPDKIDGDEEGEVEYALLRSEWERLAAERSSGATA
jgi:RimJ/RimL family protein N-acetyltransferase